MGFAVAPNDSFLIQYSKEKVEYVRIDNKGKIEQVLPRMPVVISGGLVA
jgi:adenylate kinase family enzyme